MRILRYKCININIIIVTGFLLNNIILNISSIKQFIKLKSNIEEMGKYNNIKN